MKLLFIVVDGLGDRPIPDFGGKTPLEYANTPNLDKIASLGMNGLLHVIAPGVTPGSDTAHLALFGYDPLVFAVGRGALSSAGVGMSIRPGDIAARGNFCTLDNTGNCFRNLACRA